jgi:hypothetical protein
MVPLSHVLVELRLIVHSKVQSANDEWLFLIARIGSGPSSVPTDCMYIYSGVEDDPDIWEEEADAIRRHFKPPTRGGKIITLGL